jgi:hypothetical protein
VDCREFRRLIWEELDGVLGGARLEKFNEHRKNCPACEREYFKQRRIKLYMRAFPTVGGVSDHFRSELVTRLRNGDLRSHYRLNYLRISATMAVFALVLVGMLFAVNYYENYIEQTKRFIAIYPEGPEAVKSVALPRLENELGLRENQPVYALAMPNLRTEDFVLKLLAEYQGGQVSDRLVSVLAEKTGLLDGVSMHLQDSSALGTLIGQRAQTVVSFPKPLPSFAIAFVERSDLAELRKFTLDVINTYGHTATPFGNLPELAPGMVTAVKEQWRTSDIVDVAGGSFSESSVPDGTVPLVMTFLGSQSLGSQPAQP